MSDDTQKDMILFAGTCVWILWMGVGLVSVNPDPMLRVHWMVAGIFTMLLCILAAICQEDA